MGRPLRRIAAFLSSLSPEGYSTPPAIVGTVNYLLDSYFAKSDERLSRLRDKPSPPDLDAHIKELWIGCEIHQAVSLNASYPAFARSLNAWAFTRLFRQYGGPSAVYDIVPFLDSYEYKDLLKSSSSYRIQYEPMNISLEETVTLPVYGTFFVRNNVTGAHLVVSIDLCYHSMACVFTVLSHSHAQKEAERFFFDLQTSMKTNDIYFKKCLAFVKGHLDFMPVIPTSWEDVILKDVVKDQIRDNSARIVDKMDALASVGMSPNRNVMLISPPGMAKTTMFRATSNEMDGKATRVWCTGKSIFYPEHVTSLFEAARTLAPCVVFIEDMDLFGGDRNTIGRDSTVLNEFLAQLDGTSSNSGIIVMASTNDMCSMDEALINRPSRFHVKVEIPYPDAEDRGKMLHAFLQGYKVKLDQAVTIDAWNTVIQLTDGFTGDYIRELARAAVIRATAAGRNTGDKVVLIADDLTAAGEQAIKGFQIGKRAKKHHRLTSEIDEVKMASHRPRVPGLLEEAGSGPS